MLIFAPDQYSVNLGGKYAVSCLHTYIVVPGKNFSSKNHCSYDILIDEDRSNNIDRRKDVARGES